MSASPTISDHQLPWPFTHEIGHSRQQKEEGPPRGGAGWLEKLGVLKKCPKKGSGIRFTTAYGMQVTLDCLSRPGRVFHVGVTSAWGMAGFVETTDIVVQGERERGFGKKRYSQTSRSIDKARSRGSYDLGTNHLTTERMQEGSILFIDVRQPWSREGWIPINPSIVIAGDWWKYACVV